MMSACLPVAGVHFAKRDTVYRNKTRCGQIPIRRAEYTESISTCISNWLLATLYRRTAPMLAAGTANAMPSAERHNRNGCQNPLGAYLRDQGADAG